MNIAFSSELVMLDLEGAAEGGTDPPAKNRGPIGDWPDEDGGEAVRLKCVFVLEGLPKP